MVIYGRRTCPWKLRNHFNAFTEIKQPWPLQLPVTLFSWGSLVGPLLLGLAQAEHVPRLFRGPGEGAVAPDLACEKIRAPAQALWGSGMSGPRCSCSAGVQSARAPLGGGLPLWSPPLFFFFCPSFFGMKMEDEGSNRPPAWAGLSPPHVLLPKASPSSVPRSERAATSPPRLLSPRCLHPGTHAHLKGCQAPLSAVTVPEIVLQGSCLS